MKTLFTRASLAVCALTLVVAGCRSSPPTRNSPPPDSANKLPFGRIGAPTPNETVGRVVDVVGWALDDSAVRVVNVHVDGRYQVSAPLDVARPDVAKAYPQYATVDARHGWHAIVDLGEKPGAHQILVQAVDDRGGTGEIGAIVVNLIGR